MKRAFLWIWFYHHIPPRRWKCQFLIYNPDAFNVVKSEGRKLLATYCIELEGGRSFPNNSAMEFSPVFSFDDEHYSVGCRCENGISYRDCVCYRGNRL